jgi:hypothetical protein
MKKWEEKRTKSKAIEDSPPRKSQTEKSPANNPTEPPVPLPNAFLEEAKREPKRKLLSDHIETINLLRNEKRFAFRAIAEWLTARGIETDHSAVYRAYLGAVPVDQRDPNEDWPEIEPE